MRPNRICPSRNPSRRFQEGDEANWPEQCATFDGDIDWAKTQLEVLLKSTSKEIANDALENALLIAANSVEDTLRRATASAEFPCSMKSVGQQQKGLGCVQ